MTAVDALDERAGRQSRLVVEQLFGGQLLQPEVVPPLGVLLAAVPVDQIREQPARVLGVSRDAGLGGSRPAVARAAHRPPAAARTLRSRRHLLASRSRDRRRRRPQGLGAERSSQSRRPRSTGSRPRCSPAPPREYRLVMASGACASSASSTAISGCAAFVERRRAVEAVVLLELLDRVALDAAAHGLPDDGVQIDEALGAKQRSSASARVTCRPASFLNAVGS